MNLRQTSDREFKSTFISYLNHKIINAVLTNVSQMLCTVLDFVGLIYQARTIKHR